ncbi:restriction endonuclease subunit S [Photobacterium leiognathi]|uniref:restriction endonuclease subunit S n=1 Tax=Photobacterium leiognathi TaxID=553611 RepID=UPI002980D76B|nr:restriction endonuclease subunit S [Photobacterium leiognathi]
MSKYQAYPEYKDSDIEWLGDIPTHWSAKPIKFLCTYNDEVINDSTDNNYEIEYVDIGSVSASTGITKTETICFSKAPSRARRIVKDGDVIISTVRTYLEAIAPINNPPSNMVVSTGFAVIRPTSELHKDFAAYCLRAKGFIKEVVARSVGVSYPAINASDLVNISIPFVGIDEQTQIAAFLDHETAKIDTLIEKQQQLIELLKEKRQAVISHAVTKGLNPDAPMKDSGVEWLGEVPEHWGVYKLKHACSEIFLGLTSKVDYVDFGGIPLVRALNINGGILDLTQARHISEAQHKKLTTYRKAARNDVLLSKSGTIGTAAIVDTDIEFSIYESIFALRAIKEILHPKYLLFFIQSSVAKSQYSKGSVGMGVHHLNMPDIEEVLIPIPSLNMQELILNKLNVDMLHFEQLVDNAKKSIKLMQERRTALISAAVTGKIDVRNWVAPTTSSDTTEKLSATV